MNAYSILRCTALEGRLASALPPAHHVLSHTGILEMPGPLMEPWRGRPKIPEASFELAALLLGACQLQLRPLGWSPVQITKP